MKLILATTALTAILAAPTLAGSTGTPKAETQAAEALPMHVEFLAVPEPQSLEASDIIGARVYVSDDTPNQPVTDIVAEWDDIGEVDDLLVTRDGRVDAALVDVGGFLGIGEKTVAVSIEGLDIVSQKDGDGWFVVFAGNRAMLEAAPEFSATELEAGMTPAPAESRVDGVQTSTERSAEAQLEQWLEEGVFSAPMPDVALYGYSEVSGEELTTEMLAGAPVFDSQDRQIGTVERLLMTHDGQIDAGVLEVGGVLGIGAKPVAVDFDSLSIQRDGDENLRVYVDMPESVVEQLPSFEG